MATTVQSSIDRAPFATRISAGAHTLAADEPGELGGRDTGPSPVDLLLASLTACKAITVRMYADRKGWPLEGVDAAATVAARSGHVVQAINVSLTFRGDLTPEQRDRLLTIAEMCPIQKAIVAGVRVSASLAESGPA